MAPVDLEPVLALDRQVFGADRAAVLRWAWARAPELARIAREGGRVVGYCFGRHGDHSDHVGPVVADDLAVALDLVGGGIAAASLPALIVDAAVDAEWVHALSDLGFREERPFTRMYLEGPRAHRPPRRERAVFGPEFA